MGTHLEFNFRAPEFKISLVSESAGGLVLRMPRQEIPEKILPGSQCVMEGENGRRRQIEIRECRVNNGWLEFICTYLKPI